MKVAKGDTSIFSKDLVKEIDEDANSEGMQIGASKPTSLARKPPMGAPRPGKRKQKKPRPDLNNVLSTPRDNEADHDDRPTTQEDEELVPQDHNESAEAI